MGAADQNHFELSEHFFRSEYTRMVGVISRYIGNNYVETAEDIVQETLAKAVDYWQHNGLPENPQAWLYVTAKNLTLNLLKKEKRFQKFSEMDKSEASFEIDFSEHSIMDEQLRMIFSCCHPSIPKNTQIALILKILSGFSINEIASAFFSIPETIKKRLVRGRKKLRECLNSMGDIKGAESNLEVVLTAIYLLFNEGYRPTHKMDIIRFDLCLEAIRLTQILIDHDKIDESHCHALMALMCLNASRFEARVNQDHEIIEMKNQDRSLWNKELINKGLHHLNMAIEQKKVSKYLLLANVSANHCIASSYEKTNWEEILYLYDGLIQLEDSPVVRINRCVALAMVEGNKRALDELHNLQGVLNTNEAFLLKLTLGELSWLDNETNQALLYFNEALSLTRNDRDKALIRKKIDEVVPIPK